MNAGWTDRTALIGASIFSALLGIAVYFDFIWFALFPFLILLVLVGNETIGFIHRQSS